MVVIEAREGRSLSDVGERRTLVAVCVHEPSAHAYDPTRMPGKDDAIDIAKLDAETLAKVTDRPSRKRTRLADSIKALFFPAKDEARLIIHESDNLVLRVQLSMFDAANPGSEIVGGLINWDFFADKFPGDLAGEMERMFCALIGIQRHLGRLRWGAFRDSERVETDLLADNLAGVLNDSAGPEGRDALYAALPTGTDGGLFHWELDLSA